MSCWWEEIRFQQWCLFKCVQYFFGGVANRSHKWWCLNLWMSNKKFPRDDLNSVWKIGAGRSWINSPSVTLVLLNVFLIIILGVWRLRDIDVIKVWKCWGLSKFQRGAKARRNAWLQRNTEVPSENRDRQSGGAVKGLSWVNFNMSSDHFTPVGWVILGIILASYIGILICHYKDPY